MHRTILHVNQNGVTVAERSPSHEFPWPLPSRPMFFYACAGQEEISASGTSYLNRYVTSSVNRFLTLLTEQKQVTLRKLLHNFFVQELVLVPLV